MNESKDKKFDNKFLEIALMICYFVIPFFGLQWALKNFLREDDLSFWYIVVVGFIGGNIMTLMILILNEKTLKTKAIWTAGLLLSMILINFLLR